MKKKVIVTSILGLLFIVGAMALFLFAGDIVNGMNQGHTPYTFEGNFNVAAKGGLFGVIGELTTAQFAKMGVMSFVNIGITAILLILLIVQFVLLIKKRHGVALWEFFGALIMIAGVFFFLTITFAPGYLAAKGAPFYSVVGKDGNTYAGNDTLGAWGLFIALLDGKVGYYNFVHVLIFFIPAVLFLVGFILLLVGLIADMRLLAALPKPKKKGVPSEDEVFVIDDDELEDDQAAQAARENLQRNGGYQAERRAEPIPPAPGIQGPLLIQYINTYAPADGQAVRNQKGNVPLSEIQSNINGDKPLTAEEIRKIINEEMNAKKEPSPVIVSVPAPEKAPAEERLTAEDVRAIFSEELGKYLAQDEETCEDQIYVEEEPEPEPEPEPVPEALTAEDIRQIIASAIAESKAADEKKAREAEEAKAAEKARQEEIEAAKAKAVADAIAEVEAKYKEKEQPEPKPEPAPQPAALTAEDIRQIIAAELAKAPEEEKKDDAAITADMIREIIRNELKDAAPVKEEKVAPVTVIIKEKEEVVAEPQPEPEPVVVPVVVEPEPQPEPEPEPEPEPQPEEKPQRVVGAVNPDLPPHDKIIRIPFPTRMVEGEPDLKSNYNELKSEIMSYGVKSRVSNSGDTFRLHKVTFVKITVAGKGLKLYFALEPKDYANSTLPVQDAGHKGTYKDIPLVFKVKSELSVRRAKQLIADVMEKNNIEQGKIEPHNWADELKDYKPAGSDKDDD